MWLALKQETMLYLMSPKEALVQARMEMLIAGLLLTLASVIGTLLFPLAALPFGGIGAFLALASADSYLTASGAVKARSRAERAENYAREMRFLRQEQDQGKKARDETRLLLRYWGDGHPTTKRSAEEVGIAQERWEEVVALAVKRGLGTLVPTHGGNRTLKLTASRERMYQEAGRI